MASASSRLSGVCDVSGRCGAEAPRLPHTLNPKTLYPRPQTVDRNYCTLHPASCNLATLHL